MEIGEGRSCGGTEKGEVEKQKQRFSSEETFLMNKRADVLCGFG